MLSTTGAQHSTLALGITAIGILAAGAFNVWSDDRFVPAVVFLGAVPLLTTMILVIWMSQMVGMLDVGLYLLSLEGSIRQHVDDAQAELMTWEKRISHQTAVSRRPNYAWHYVAVVVLFGLLGLSSIVLGAYRADDSGATLAACLIGAVFAAVCVAIGALVVTARRRNREAAKHLWEPGTSAS